MFFNHFRIILFQKTFLIWGEAENQRDYLSPLAAKRFFKGWIWVEVTRRVGFAADRQSVKRSGGGGRCEWAGQEAEALHWGCEECWYVAPANIQRCRAADPLWNVCVWRLNSVLISARRHTQTETGRNKRRRSRQSWSEIAELGKRLQVGCTAARGALETNPLVWTVSKKKQCAVFRPSTREGEQCYIKKAMQLASNAQPVDTVSSLHLWEKIFWQHSWKKLLLNILWFLNISPWTESPTWTLF